MPQNKTSAAHVEAFKESLRETAELLRDVGITETMKPSILDFVTASTMNDLAAAARKAARLVRGDDEAADNPTCAHHAIIINIFEEGRKAIMDGVVCEMMSIRRKEDQGWRWLRTNVGWFSSPSCALIYQCSKYVALHSSKGCLIGAKFRQ
eukprot:629316-Pleurochrysis_carterae.AAC.1